MSFKSIRESYQGMIGALDEAGLKLSDTQKKRLDESVTELENGISMQRQNAIRQTRRLTEARLEKEYRQVFESIMANQAKNAELASKIQEKVLKMNEAQTLAGKVSDYLELYLESVLPRKTVVDYDRMQKLERLHESLKDMLGVDEFGMQERMQKLEESKNDELEAAKEELRKCKRVNEAFANKIRRQTKMLAEAKKTAIEPVEKKQIVEAKAEKTVVKKADAKHVISEAVAPETEKQAKTNECECKDCKEKKADPQIALEAEIDGVLNDNEFNQCGMFNNQAHNGHKDDQGERRFGEAEKDKEEVFETIEQIETDESGDVKLDESEIIDGDLMQFWCSQAIESN